jgi:hypothetical protein
MFFFARSFFELQVIKEVESDNEAVVLSVLLLENPWDSVGAVIVINGVGTGVVAGDGSVRHSDVERDGMR